MGVPLIWQAFPARFKPVGRGGLAEQELGDPPRIAGMKLSTFIPALMKREDKLYDTSRGLPEKNCSVPDPVPVMHLTKLLDVLEDVV